MELKFDQLINVLLEDIFKLLDPEEVIDFCFLSKELFNIVSEIAKYNPTYPLYDQNKTGRYWNYREKFIKNNGGLMKHINIESENIEYLTCCSNSISISYLNTYNNRAIEFGFFNTKYSSYSFYENRPT
ncbi:hypothetical protein K502DRAFT_322863 [Neoconidiobolus thromboides FSU 785]|nr:hypothetical protein K502DRAFT_322863 [Neoconidiobolus thromboides FSU 785]